MKKYRRDQVEQEMKRNVRLGDTVLVAVGSSVKEGNVTFISERGIVLKNDRGAIFYKWCHVMKIKQNVNTLCIGKELKGEQNMGNNVLMTIITNNGYGCSCCVMTWKEHEWIKKEKMMSLSQLMDHAATREPYQDFGDTIRLMYEEDGEKLYGFKLHVTKMSYTMSIQIRDKTYDYDPDGQKGFTKEQLMQRIQRDFKNDHVIVGGIDHE